jgi:CubicO group peptidase (beta-lactamase class C family)
MTKPSRALVVLILFGVLVQSPAVEKRSASALPRSRPEAQGVSSAALLPFIEALDQLDAMNSFMLVRHGNVVAEGWWAPYDAGSHHELYSLSKSFTSTAVGLAVAEGRLSIDDEVLKFFPDDAPAERSGNLKAMRVRDLLTMAAGHQDETPSAPEKISAKAFLAHPVPHKPGTHFKYNTPATFMLSAIVQKQTGQTVLDYLRPRLFEPLGISNPVWNTNWQGISLGGYGLNVRTEDIARLGQLYLQKGKWHGRQLLSPEWVELATSRQVSNGSNPRSDWDQGYGFQFWRCRNGGFRGDGAFGQYCVVLPEQDAVIAITSGVKDMQSVLNLIWDKLLPALKPDRLMRDAVSLKMLTEKLGGLRVRPVEGLATSPVAEKIFGRTYTFPTNGNEQRIESVTFSPLASGSGVAVTLVMDGRTSRISCGFQDWQSGRGSIGGYVDVPIGGTAAWISDDICVLKICASETPFYYTLKFRFADDQVFHDADANLGFRPTRRTQLIGRAMR